MKLVRLDNRSLEYFQGLDPFGYLQKHVPFTTIALGTAEENRENLTPTGLVLCYVESAVIVVRWLFVAPTFRGKGLSDTLLSAVYEIAQGEGKKYVGALLLDSYGRREVCPDEEAFFRFQGFDEEVPFYGGKARLLLSETSLNADDTPDLYESDDDLPFYGFSFDIASSSVERERPDALKGREADIVIKAGDIFKCNALMKAEPDDNEKTEVVSIGDITFPMLGDGIKKCSQVTADSCFSGPIRNISTQWYDLKLSTCSIVKGAVTGLFLVHEEDGDLWTEYMCACGADSPIQCLRMMQKSAAVLLSEYPEDTKVMVRYRDDKARGLVDHLFFSDM